MEKLKDNTEELRRKVDEASKYVANQKHTTGYLVARIKEFNLQEPIATDMLVDLIGQLQ